MKTSLLMESASAANPADTVKVTRGMLRERAFEVASLESRAPQDASKSDWEQAKQELMTSPDAETLAEPSVSTEGPVVVDASARLKAKRLTLFEQLGSSAHQASGCSPHIKGAAVHL